MSRRDIFRALAKRPIEKDSELYVFIAENVGIRCSTDFVFANHIINDLFFVFFGQIDFPKRNGKMRGHAHGVEPIFSRCASEPLRTPDLYENADNVVSLVFQKRRRDGGIDAAGDSNENFLHRAIILKKTRLANSSARRRVSTECGEEPELWRCFRENDTEWQALRYS